MSDIVHVTPPAYRVRNSTVEYEVNLVTPQPYRVIASVEEVESGSFLLINATNYLLINAGGDRLIVAPV